MWHIMFKPERPGDMGVVSKPLVWIHGEISTPRLLKGARIEAGFLLRKLQEGEGDEVRK